MVATGAQIAANHTNAHRLTGPRTLRGQDRDQTALPH
jgi:hypothetical protein